MVTFLRDALLKKGCPNLEFTCSPCEGYAGRYDPEKGRIELCEDAIQSVSHVEDTLSHELIHAFDHCRVEWEADSKAVNYF